MRLSRPLLSILLTAILCPSAARAFDGGAWTLQPGEWYSEVDASRISSSSRFLSDARDAAIPSEGRFAQNQWRWYSELGWHRNLAFALGIPFTTRTWRFFEDTRTISGLSDMRAGVRIRLRDDAPGLVLDAGWLAPLGYNKNVFPNLGDGRQKAYVALNAGAKLPGLPAFAQASRGFVFIGEDGILLANTTVDAAAWVGRSLLIGARYADQMPWNTGSQVSALATSYVGGPVATVRVDDRLDFTVGAMRQMFGRNALGGTEIYVTLGFKQSKLNALQGFLGNRKRP